MRSAGAPTASAAASAGGDAMLADSAMPTPTTAAGAASPAASVTRGRRTCSVERRSGSSTQRNVSHAGSSDASATAPRPQPGSGPSATPANTSTGQCQTYQAYDTRPTQRTGRSVSARVGPACRSLVPAAISATAPSVGTSAAGPGNGVSSPNATLASAIAARPSQPATAAVRHPSRRCASPTASSAPSPSSHARANAE